MQDDAMPGPSFSEAFAQYGAKLRNVQWSVCANAPDGSLVVSLWEHHFLPPKDGRVICRDWFDRWRGPGNAEFRAAVLQAFTTSQRVCLVISHAERPALVQAGVDAGTARKSFTVKKEWIGRVSKVAGEEYEFEFVHE